MNVPRLGINIDHVATLRQARGEDYPNLKKAAEICVKAGADQITMHLREDRRHIQDNDIVVVHEFLKEKKIPLNMEMGVSEDILQLAIKQGPEWICLVPEKREERTTEGGLDLISNTNFEKIKKTCQILKDKHPQIKISLFLEAKKEILEKAYNYSTLIDAVEVHTGDYAIHYNQKKTTTNFFDDFEMCFQFFKETHVGVHAGHGITLENYIPLLEFGRFAEYNIGHSVICQSVFEGLENVVSKFLALTKKYQLKK